MNFVVTVAAVVGWLGGQLLDTSCSRILEAAMTIIATSIADVR